MQNSLFNYSPFDKNVLVDLLNVYIKYNNNSDLEYLETNINTNINYDDPRQLIRLINLLLCETNYAKGFL